jgi:hypothetical protein
MDGHVTLPRHREVSTALVSCLYAGHLRPLDQIILYGCESCSVTLKEKYRLRAFEYTVKVKVNLSLCLTKHHAMKTYWGSGGIAPRILDLGTRWR